MEPRAIASAPTRAPVEFLLRLGDNALILSQRLSEWTGHGPELEEDIALTNIALDLLGQARMLLNHAGAGMQPPREEDALAFWRDANEFRNVTALELPNSGVHAARGAAGDYAFTILRQTLFSAYMLVLWPMLAESDDEVLAGIAMKAIKETRYHWRHASDWTQRLGDGTELSNQRMQAALDQYFPYTNEWFMFDAIDAVVLRHSLKTLDQLPDAATEDAETLQHEAASLALMLRENWLGFIDPLLRRANLRKPAPSQLQTRGRFGVHGEHLSILLNDMQSVSRAHPGVSW